MYLLNLNDEEIDVMASMYAFVEKHLPEPNIEGLVMVRRWYFSRFGDGKPAISILGVKLPHQHDWTSNVFRNAISRTFGV